MSLLGWIANAFIIVGLLKIGSKNWNCFYYAIIGELIWVYEAINRSQYDLAFICFVFAAIAVVNLSRLKGKS